MIKHSACARGKRVLVILRDGGRLEDRFLERHGGFIWLEEAGKIALEDVRTFSIRKGEGVQRDSKAIR